MLRFTNNNGTSTDWLRENPTDKELAKMNIEQLLILAKKKPGFKKNLLEFLHGIKLK